MISIVIPALRARNTIRRVLESFRGQTREDWEIVIAEDGEDDGSRGIVAAFAETPAQPLAHVPLGGHRCTSVARNAALDRCRGDLVAFLDADDEWAPTHLSTMAACLDGGHALAVSAVEIWDTVAGRRIAVHGMCPDWLAAPRDAVSPRTAWPADTHSAILHMRPTPDGWRHSCRSSASTLVTARS